MYRLQNPLRFHWKLIFWPVLTTNGLVLWLHTEIRPQTIRPQIAKFMGPTWGPPGSYRPQMGPILAPWILLSRDPRPQRPLLESSQGSTSLIEQSQTFKDCDQQLQFLKQITLARCFSSTPQDGSGLPRLCFEIKHAVYIALEICNRHQKGHHDLRLLAVTGGIGVVKMTRGVPHIQSAQ